MCTFTFKLERKSPHTYSPCYSHKKISKNALFNSLEPTCMSAVFIFSL